MSALSICIVLSAFVVVVSICLLYVNFGSRVSPGILGLTLNFRVHVSGVFFICNVSCVLYSAGSGALLEKKSTTYTDLSASSSHDVLARIYLQNYDLNLYVTC